MTEIIKFRNTLLPDCHFQHLWDDINSSKLPRSEMGYMRSFFRDRQWNTVPVIVSKNLVTLPRWKELMELSAEICRAFPTRESLAVFCATSAEDLRNGYEYNLYCEGELAYYWIRVNTTPGDNNLYVHSLVKEAR